MIFTWNNPNYPEGAVRTELHISGSEQTCDYLHDMITEIAEPYDSYDEKDGCVLVYTSTDVANRVMAKLHKELYNLHPELIGHPDGVIIENGVLFFKGAELFIEKS